MYYRDIIRMGEQVLIQAGVDEPKWTSQILLFHIIGKSNVDIYLNDTVKINEEEKEYFINAINRLISGEPIQYIMGETMFMDVKINLKRGVFIPRPDTELIVEQCLKDISYLKNPFILEIGTGSGAIAISLAHFRKDVKIIATDISEIAIKQAKINAYLNGVQDNIYFVVGSLYDPLNTAPQFDLIVSNPPYIPDTAISQLPPNVLQEPIVAINGGENGVQILNSIIQECGLYLNNYGKVILEIDPVNIEYIEIPDCYGYKFLHGFSGEERGIILWKR